MAHFKGGRGRTVGYETQMYRIPTPLRPTVEKAGLQFRLLWDGLTDPTGEKLISRIERAIPDPEQLGEDNGLNQISDKSHISISDIKLASVVGQLSHSNGHSLISSNTPVAPISDIRFQEMEKELEKAKGEAEFWRKRAGEPNPRVKELELLLQTCQAANSKMEQGWTRDRQELTEVREQLAYELDRGGNWYRRIGEIEEELEQMKRDQGQMTLHIESLETELGDVEEERDRWRQEWEQSLTPTTPTTATPTETKEAAISIIAPQVSAIAEDENLEAIAPTPPKRNRSRKPPTDPVIKPTVTPEELQRLMAGIKAIKLAEERLMCSRQALSIAKGKGIAYFEAWSKKHDPNGLAWRYSEEEKLYYPIVDL